jgi:hypothetical protein
VIGPPLWPGKPGWGAPGKDFIAGYVCLWFFLSRHPVRVVTTSADYSQLESVLWGEIRRFIQTSKYPLDADSGGPLVINHLHIRKVAPAGQESEGSEAVSPGHALWRGKGRTIDGLSYLIGRVAAKGEGMQGHHIADMGDGIPRTLFVADEASGVDDETYDAADTWARRKLVIGNPLPTTNFFFRGVKGGDLYAKE